jgi:putative methyltransferase (TIGR04325 family)
LSGAWAARAALNLRGRILPRTPVMRNHLIWVEGPFSDWATAENAASGYDDPLHVARVARATQAVLDGVAAFERDGVAFPEWQPDLPVALAILASHSRLSRPIRVLDVGGAMGGTFLRAAAVASPAIASWHVVEQDLMTARARQVVQDSRLTFGGSIESGVHLGPDLVILGSVMQYLKEPDAVLELIAASPATSIALTRTPLVTSSQHLPTIEHVPPRFGEMHYPMWLLSRKRLLAPLEEWQCLLDEGALGGTMMTPSGVEFQWRDLVFRRPE